MPYLSPENLRFASTIVAIGIISSVDLTRPDYILIARIIFGIVQAITLLLCAYVYTKISEREEGGKIRVPHPSPWGATPEPNDYTEMSIKEYDLAELKKFAQQTAFSTVFISFLSYKFEVVPPLIFTAVSAPSVLLGTNILRAYLNEPEMERPFKEEPSAMAKLYQQFTQPTPDEQQSELEQDEKPALEDRPATEDDSTPEEEEEEEEEEQTRAEEKTSHEEEPILEDVKPRVEEKVSQDQKTEELYDSAEEKKSKKNSKEKKHKKSSDDSSSSSSSSDEDKESKKNHKEKKQNKNKGKKNN
jgi:chemotaxis protein histidine kinase CheA